MKKFSELKEARGDTAVFTFGRFNPPTTGHELLLNKVAAVAKQNAGAPYYIFASHSENPKKDPLPYTKKVAYMKKMFRKHARNIVVDKARNVFEIAVSLHNKGHKAIVMVVGSDRVSEFDSLLNKYNGVEARHGYYGFDNIEIVSAGERDPDAEGVSGMSASKMRAAASANDFDQFKLGLPKGFNQGMSLFKDVRKFMGIRESFIVHQVQQTEEDVIRDMYLENKIFTIGEEVTDTYTGVTGKIIRRGTNYVTFATEDGTTYKKWLYELELAEDCWPGFKQVGMKKKNGKDVPNCVPVDEKQDKDIKDREGTQPAKYYAKDAEGDKMAKSTKQARARHFEKGASKDDDDDSAYKPAPGDKSAKTKPSQHTNKMKKKFPDLYKEMKENADKSLAKKAEASGISVSILKQVYKRGVAAWRTGHRPGTTPEQWGHARVNSFITGGKTRTTADADLWKQHKGKSEEKEDPREIGTDARRERAQDMTPGQKVVKFTEHVNCGTPSCCNECETSSLIESNVYRVGSEKYYEFFQEKRDEYKIGVYNPIGFDKELMEGDLGKFDIYQGQHVPLDCPMVEEKDVELNKPKVGGPKKYYVYVKDPSTGNIKKVTWGDTTGLKVKLNDPEARKSFAARHDCENAKDRTKASYWACNLPRYAKQLGLSGGGNFFW